jgi:phosphoribosylaminoimidazole-succinocarboxamide synthase
MRIYPMNTRRTRIYEGKAKILYEGPEPGTLVVHYKDDATAFNAQKKAVIEGKGVINNRISEFVFTKLNEIGLPTHFIRRLNMREQLIREVEIIPVEVVVRNIAAGSLATRLGMEEGTALPRSIIEFYYKNDELGDPMISEEHITAFNWASPQEIDDIMAMSIRVNDFLSGLFLGIGIKLIDFKLEFGRLYEGEMVRTVVADEISPDNCRLWDIKSGDKLDKDRFRRDMGGLVEAYQEVAAGARQDRLSAEPAARMKARITITLKNGVLDPQGKAIEGALHALGFGDVANVRQGKLIELDIPEGDDAAARNQLRDMCEKLLANTVIEEYRVEDIR